MMIQRCASTWLRAYCACVLGHCLNYNLAYRLMGTVRCSVWQSTGESVVLKQDNGRRNEESLTKINIKKRPQVP